MSEGENGSKPLRILHLEDSKLDAEIIRERLSEAGFSIQIDLACGEKEYTRYLIGSKYDLILADYFLPSFNALLALRLAKLHSPDLPFIVVSGAIGEEKAVDLLKQGATDFVSKDRLNKLPLAINRALDEVREHKSRHQAEAELRHLNERYALATRAASLGVWDWDLQNNKLIWDDRMYELYGVKKEDFVGVYDAWLARVHPDDRAKSDMMSKLARQGEQEYDTEFRVVWPDGGIHYLKAYGFVVRDTDGKPLRMTGINFDISEMKESEISLRKLNETLEQMVEEEVERSRNKDLIMIQQSRLATMGEMIQNIAHQWRQPLNTLVLILDNILADYEANELDHDCLRKYILDSKLLVQKMSSTIDDFRRFFRPESQITAFSVKSSFLDAMELMEGTLKNLKVKIVFQEGEEINVLGFFNEFSHVLMNVITNAVEAIMASQIENGEITFAVERCSEHACIQIRNNGGQIPEDVLPKIFDPYFTTKERGSGIGLFMSRKIVEHMNGQMIASNIENGVEFLIALPLAPDSTITSSPV